MRSTNYCHTSSKANPRKLISLAYCCRQIHHHVFCSQLFGFFPLGLCGRQPRIRQIHGQVCWKRHRISGVVGKQRNISFVGFRGNVEPKWCRKYRKWLCCEIFVTKSKLKASLTVWRKLLPYIFQGGLRPGSPFRRATPDQHDSLLRYLSHCSKIFQESNALQQQQISHQPNVTAIFFKRISDADITCYPTQFFSMGTVFTKVITIIDQHDRLLRNPRHCSKVFKNLTHFNNSRFLIINVLQKHRKCTKYWFQSKPKTKYTLAHNFKASKPKLLLWFREHQRCNENKDF